MHIIRAAFFVAALGLCHGAGHLPSMTEAEEEHHEQLHHHHMHNMDISPPSPVPEQMSVQRLSPPQEYEAMKFNVINARDHGCAEFAHDHDEADGCINIWLKNRFSAAGIAPRQFFTEFEYHGTPHSYRPVVTWVESVQAQYVRACAAAVPGQEHVLAGGKIKWVALYNYTQNVNEQSGSIEQGPLYEMRSLTAAKHCFHINFPQAFASPPVMKFTLNLKHGYHSAQDALVVFAKGISSTGAVVCLEEFHAWARYHTDYQLFWYGIANGNGIFDNYAESQMVSFGAGDLQPADHNRLNDYYCKTVTLAQNYWPCPAILVQAVEPSLEVCESPVSAWVAHHNERTAVLCYRDRRGLASARRTEVQIHYIVYGAPDKCNTLQCPANKECIHQADGSAVCGCIKSCPVEDDVVCGSDMKEYPNRCELEKQSCESNFKFVYAHKGNCEKYTFAHGRQILPAVPSCHGLYCADVSTRDHVWYKDAEINVQISTSFNGQRGSPSASWIESVTPKKFRACVMLPGRAQQAQGPMIHWFAYQGEMDEIKSHRIEVGDWQSGTHCVPVHERRPMQEAEPFHPDVCPQIRLQDVGKVDQDGWRYDAHLMSQIYGQHHHEWFKRMLMGYGVKKMNLTNGMEMGGVTLMMTVEQTKSGKAQDVRDAVNVWMEYDESKHESYVCLRELQNFDGKHEGIHVHWTLFNKSMIHDLGFSHKLHFKPTPKAEGFQHNAQCQTKAYLPSGMNLINSATALVSLSHRIQPYSAMDSMKKYHMHRHEVMEGMSMGDGHADSTKDVQASYMMPHMWRANLTGWRPHMRIEKNTDYSAWIENMNNTHITVCQQSTFNGHSHSGVSVDVFIMPDRCPATYEFINNHMCAKYSSQCQTPGQAHDICKLSNAYVASPDSCQSAVHLAFLAQQNSFVIAKTDANVEGNWVPGYGAPLTSTWDNWAPGNPTSGVLNDNDCAYQRGANIDRNLDVKEFEQKCSDCQSFICVMPAPWLSCNFRNPDYCNNCGKCTTLAPFSHSCGCIPPYSGTHCEVRLAKADP